MWRTVESSVADVRRAVVKVRILTGTYMLQGHRQKFSNGTVDAVCRHCRLGDEDLLHLVSRCPAFHDIRVLAVNALKDIVTNQGGQGLWYQCFKDWLVILKTFVCIEAVLKFIPELAKVKDSIEQLSRDFFYKIHVRKLQFENLTG